MLAFLKRKLDFQPIGSSNCACLNVFKMLEETDDNIEYAIDVEVSVCEAHMWLLL